MRHAFWILVLGVAWLAGTTAPPVRADTVSDVRQVWQLLDYIAVDYKEAVTDGTVSNAAEYREMVDFAAAARERVAALPADDRRIGLVAEVESLQAAIAARSPPEEVTRVAHGAAERLLGIHPLPDAPSQAPDLARGADLYAEQCAACHGARGAGDGPAAPNLEPPPIAFTDRERARGRSPFALYQTISQGVPETSMVAYAELSEADRWALAFYTAGLSHSPADRRAGERLWQEDPSVRGRFANLETLARTTEADLVLSLGEERARALLAYLRAQPSAVLGDNLALARSLLRESVQAYQNGDVDGATRLALSAYLDGFEPIEPQLAASGAELLERVELAMAEYRARISRGAPSRDVAEQGRILDELFAATETFLAGSSADASVAFLGSFTVLLREGLEALLIVIAMVAFLRKAERPDMLPYVHAGWAAALGAGVLTWGVATYLRDISGAGRELTEGYSSLFAAAVLLSVGMWMHQQSVAGQWQRFLSSRLSQILTGRSAWLLTGIAFVAVYREVFETILFYVAMWRQGSGAAIVGGGAAAAAALALIATLLLRTSARLPIAKFFSASSILIAVIAVVLAGKGVAALQEAGVLSVWPLPIPRVSVLGIYPSAQTLLTQLIVLLLALAGFAWNTRSVRRQESSA